MVSNMDMGRGIFMRIKGWKQIISIVSMVTIVISMSGCKNKKQQSDPTFSQPSTNTQSSQETQSEDSGDKANQTEESTKSNEDTRLIIGCDGLEDDWNPFLVNTESNLQVIEQTQVYLLIQERGGQIVTKAKQGQTIPFGGTDYTYQGLSDVDITRDAKQNMTTYTITLRDDVTFSDGSKLTADDVIFSLYVLCDPSYDGIYQLKESNIVGLQNYVADNSLADTITADMIEDKIKNPSEELHEKIREEAILPLLHEELELCRDMLGKEAYSEFTKDYTQAKEVLAHIYSIDPEYSVTDSETEEQVIEELALQYGFDYKRLASIYGDETYFDEQVSRWAREEICDELKEQGAESVPSIEGIVKKSDDCIEIITQGYDAEFLYELRIPVCPLHYYGDEAAYDYENQHYGFTKGDLSKVIDQDTIPMGAGPYQVVSVEEDSVLMEAYQDFYLGNPVTKQIQLKEVSEGEKIIGVGEQTLDLVDIAGSRARFDEIKEYNTENQLSGDVITTRVTPASGYGYIGMNANTVNVGGDLSSSESKYLRKALATVLSVYRDAAIESYYSDAATVIQLPETSFSWTGAVETENKQETTCFSTDLNGESIYADEMRQEDRYRVALTTAKEYLKVAGYTYEKESGKFIEAPEGAKLQYDIYINGQGIGDHPSYGILSAAKAALESIGITLTIHDTTDGSILWDAIEQGDADLWCAAWQTSAEPTYYEKYFSDTSAEDIDESYNHYNIKDQQLNELLEAAQNSSDDSERIKLYEKARSIIMDWAIEVPVYQRYNACLMNTRKLKEESISKEYTAYWDWTDELYLIEVNETISD